MGVSGVVGQVAVETERSFGWSIGQSGDTDVHGSDCWSGHGDEGRLDTVMVVLRVSDPVTSLVSVVTTLIIDFFDVPLVQ